MTLTRLMTGVGRTMALAVVLAGSSAYAQTPNINLFPETKSRTPEEIERDAAADKAYRESLRKIPNARVTSDPWGDVRGAETPKAAPRAAPKAVPKTAPNAASPRPGQTN